MRNFCTKCGSRIGREDRYCGNCGAFLAYGPGPEELESVTVKELASGDIVYYRPLPTENGNDGEATLKQELNPELSISTGEAKALPDTSNILQLDKKIEQNVEATNILKPNIEEPEEAEEPVTVGSVESFSPMPQEDISISGSADPEELHDSIPIPPDIPVIEKLRLLDEMSASKSEARRTSEETFEPEPEFDDEVDESVRRFLNDEPLETQPSDSISVLGWVGITFLMLIPGVNILLLIIWALGGCRKKQKARFARAQLIVIAFFALLITGAYILFKDYIDFAIDVLLRSGFSTKFGAWLYDRIVNSVNGIRI